MDPIVVEGPVPVVEADSTPEKNGDLNGTPPKSPFRDVDAASILSATPPKSTTAASKEARETTQQCPPTDCSSSTVSAAKVQDDEKISQDTDFNSPIEDSTALLAVNSSPSKNESMDINLPNGSAEETKSLDKEASIDAELNVPIFCLTIKEGSETSHDKEIEADMPFSNLEKYRDEKESSDSDDSSVSSDSSSDCSDSFLYEMRRNVKYIPAPKTYNVKPAEDIYADLPPIEDLHIDVEESEVEKVGVVHGIVELEVVIKSLPGLKPLQLESVLFLSKKPHLLPLGNVCDVYGGVKQPFYSVRFNSKDHIKKVGVEIGMDVYYAPERTEITQYVFPEELLKIKGSDASGKNDHEPSDDNLDYSDDEKEKEAKLRKKKSRRPARGKDSRYEPAWTNQREQSPEPINPNPNPFYSMSNVVPERPNWMPPHKATSIPTSFHNTTSRQQQFQGPTNFPPNGNYNIGPYKTFQQNFPYPQLPASPFQPPLSPFPPHGEQSPFQPPSPLVQLHFPTRTAQPYAPHSPMPSQQPGGYSPRIMQQQQQPPIGPPRPIVLQQMHMFGQMTPIGPMSPAPHLSYAPPNLTSPPPSTAFPPASPNFSYFSHPFPSAPSPNPNVSRQSYYRGAPSPNSVQVASPMSPLSIQIPNHLRPSQMVTRGVHRQGNHNLLQQNIGGYNPMQRY